MNDIGEGLNCKAAALDSQTGESFLIGIKAALETLWSTYLNARPNVNFRAVWILGYHQGFNPKINLSFAL